MPEARLATYFDGVTSAQHRVLIDLEPASISIRALNGTVLAEWPYVDLRAIDAPQAMLRLGRAAGPEPSTLARLEILDPDLAQAIGAQAPGLQQRRARERRRRRIVVGGSIAAMLSLVLGAAFGVPQLATLLTPYIPPRIERLLGDAVDRQVRAMLDTDRTGPTLECGQTSSEQDGQAALAKLAGALAAGAALPQPLRITAVHRSDANAIALPGGRIYLFDGLIEQAKTPDELAAILAHEIGHVAHRDGTRSVLQTAGLSLLFGMVLGDFVGGGAVMIAARAVLHSSYSRTVEAAADAYGVDLMAQIGGDPHALATILARIGTGHDDGVKLLRDHPVTLERVARIDAFPAPSSRARLLTPAEWAALKRICT